MRDLREDGDQELSAWVNNDEWFYTRFKDAENKAELRKVVKGFFRYTRAQFEELYSDWKEHKAYEAKRRSPIDED